MNRSKPSSGQDGPDGLVRTNDFADIASWRRATRKELLAARRALTADERRERDARIVANLEASLGSTAGACVSAYWPVRGEPDLRAWLARLPALGTTLALPVVVGPDRPLEFHEWCPDAPLRSALWDIREPEAGRLVTPDVVLVPLVGFDRHGYRLGYGGGYFDRTLAALVPQPRVVGIGYAFTELPTIHPQAHDIPMELVVTDEEAFAVA